MRKTEVLTSSRRLVGMYPCVVLYAKLVGCLFHTYQMSLTISFWKKYFSKRWKEHPVVSCDSILVYIYSTRKQYYRSMGKWCTNLFDSSLFLDLAFRVKNSILFSPLSLQIILGLDVMVWYVIKPNRTSNKPERSADFVRKKTASEKKTQHHRRPSRISRTTGAPPLIPRTTGAPPLIHAPPAALFPGGQSRLRH
jgi:hypothetical protein